MMVLDVCVDSRSDLATTRAAMERHAPVGAP